MRSVILLGLAFLIMACAVYPEIPKEYLKPKEERDSAVRISGSQEAQATRIEHF